MEKEVEKEVEKKMEKDVKKNMEKEVEKEGVEGLMEFEMDMGTENDIKELLMQEIV